MSSWLVISYFSNIDPLAPSHHIDDRLPVLSGRGISVHLISSSCGSGSTGIRHTRVPSPAPSGIRYEIRHFLRRRTSKKVWFKFLEMLLLLPVYPLYFIEKIFIRLDSTWSWFITASVFAVFYAVRDKPDVIYSTGGPVSAHITALIASRISRIPFIAETQDPLVHDYSAPNKCERMFLKRVEQWLFCKASAIVFLTKQAATNAWQRHQQTSAKTFAIYPGALPLKQIANHQKGRFFTLTHVGSLGGSRNLHYLLSAVEGIFQDSPGLLEHVRIELYGNISKAVTRQIEQFRYAAIVQARGKMRRYEAIEAMSRADVLLLIQNTDDVSFESIPSKVYEYLHTGRPVLALVYRNAELQEILQDRGYIVVQADDVESIKRGIDTYIGKWQEDSLQIVMTPSPYTVERAVDELIALARGVDDVRGRVG
jgi:glycosyltransferase involved in cell wall biosynthesis